MLKWYGLNYLKAKIINLKSYIYIIYVRFYILIFNLQLFTIKFDDNLSLFQNFNLKSKIMYFLLFSNVAIIPLFWLYHFKYYIISKIPTYYLIVIYLCNINFQN